MAMMFARGVTIGRSDVATEGISAGMPTLVPAGEAAIPETVIVIGTATETEAGVIRIATETRKKTRTAIVGKKRTKAEVATATEIGTEIETANAASPETEENRRRESEKSRVRNQSLPKSIVSTVIIVIHQAK